VSTNIFRLDFVVYANGRFVAFGEYSDYGVILTSEDGKTWTLRSDGYGQAGGASASGLSWSTGLAYTGGKFFALGGASGVSVDGIHWTVFSGPGAVPRGVAYGGLYGGSLYVAVGSDSCFCGTDLNVFTSVNGTNWTAHHSTSPSGTILSDVAYGDAADTFVALDGGAHTYTSTDGTNWTQRNISGGKYISYLYGLFIVPSAAGTNLLSGDGINWSAFNTGLTNRLEKVTLVNGLFMARAGKYLATSVDMINWTQYAQVLPGDSLACDGSRLVTVGGTYVGAANYDGYTYYSGVLVGIRMINTPSPKLVLSGLVGRSYRIEYTDALSGAAANNWRTNITLQLPADPFIWTDAAATNSRRFYRAALLP
jgi:hypothetical protein